MEEQNRVPEATHIVLTYPSQDREVMFRADSKMMVAERDKITVIYGVNPAGGSQDPTRKQSRVFMESDEPAIDGAQRWNHNGSRFMREVVAAEDLKLQGISTAPVIDERNQEGQVILAPGSLGMRTNGDGMAAVNLQPFNKSRPS